jgi:mono/diheme cytochrome c family protein
MRRNSVKCVVITAMLLSLAACSEPPQEPTLVETLMTNPDAIARGRAIFVGTCSGYCHKTTDIASDTPFLFDDTWLHGGSDQEIFDTVTNGVPNTRMVGFGSNFPEGETDLWKIIAYLRVNNQ